MDKYVEINLPETPYHKKVGKQLRSFKNFKGEICWEVYLLTDNKLAMFNERVLREL